MTQLDVTQYTTLVIAAGFVLLLLAYIAVKIR